MASSAPHNPPFRADHVGSLLRSPALLKAREDRQANRISAEQLRAIEDEEIRKVVAFQEGIGLQSITDGEYRRAGWSAGLYGQGGLGSIRPGNPELSVSQSKDIEGNLGRAPSMEVYDRIQWRGPVNVANFKFLRAATKRTPKITMPSPSYLHLRSGRPQINREVYPDLELFWADLADAFHQELNALAEAGCTYVQIDDTSLTNVADPATWERLRARGDDPLKLLLETYPAAMNRAFAGRPSSIQLSMHLCRGNGRSAWHAEGGYDVFAEALFNTIDVDSYFLEYDTPRAGTFEPLRFVPGNKTVVLGLISTKFPELESKDLIKQRIDEAAKYVDIDRICLGPQCGFASALLGNKITPADQEAKLRLVVETAREVWGDR